MAIRMLCTCGQEMITEDQYAGRKVRCPKCQGIIIVPGAPAPVPVIMNVDLGPDDDDIRYEEPRRRSSVTRREGLRRARMGLSLHWWKTLCFLVVSANLFIISLLSFVCGIAEVDGPDAAGPGLMRLAAPLMCLAAVIIIAMPILSVAGSIMCWWVPPRSGARIPNILASGLDAGAFLLYLMALAFFYANRAASSLWNRPVSRVFVAMTFLLGTLVLLLAGWFAHMLGLNKLALYGRDRRTADEVVRMLVLGLIAVIVPPLLTGGLSAVQAPAFMNHAVTMVSSAITVALAFKVFDITTRVRDLL
jgi:hypothetical protein